MKSTGIVRRIDELGRVVIPKELRRTLRLFEGEQVEMFTSEENSLVLKKFSEAQTVLDKISWVINQLYSKLDKNVLVCDRQLFIYCIGNLDITGYEITYNLFKILENRRTTLMVDDDVTLFAKGNFSSPKKLLVVPLIAYGDLYGGIVMPAQKITDKDIALCEFCADLIGSELS